jgi:hypothetical protein
MAAGFSFSFRGIESKRTTQRDEGHEVPQRWQSSTFPGGGNQYKSSIDSAFLRATL